MTWIWIIKRDLIHYNDIIVRVIASQITSLMIVYSTLSSDAGQRKHQRSAPLAFVRGIHRGPVNFLHKWPVTRKMFPFVDVIMYPESFEWVFLQYKLQLLYSKVVSTIFTLSWQGWCPQQWKVTMLMISNDHGFVSLCPKSYFGI